MTGNQIRRARRLLDELERLGHKPKGYILIRELRGLLEPLPTMKEIFDRVPGADVEAKAAKVGISRAAYYKIIKGQHRPQDQTARLLSEMSGVPIETIRAIHP